MISKKNKILNRQLIYINGKLRIVLFLLEKQNKFFKIKEDFNNKKKLLKYGVG